MRDPSSRGGGIRDDKAKTREFLARFKFVATALCRRVVKRLNRARRLTTYASTGNSTSIGFSFLLRARRNFDSAIFCN